MKVVICQINSKFVHSSLAAWCIKAGIDTYSTLSPEVKVIEGTINEKSDTVIKRIADEVPDVIGFCCYIWNISYLKAVAEKIKALFPCCKIVFGGPEVSYNPQQILGELKFVDFVISGEGELPFARLIDALPTENIPENIPENLGICYKNEGEIAITEPYTPEDEPPSPYCEEYFETLGGRIVYFETSRGCPYRCAFCLSGRCGGVRYFDIERIKNEIILLSNSKTSTIKFVDRTFNANKARAKEIIRFITQNYGKEIPTSVCFHFEIAGDILDDELSLLLSSAPKGLFRLEIGMQSFNEVTLSQINRKTNCDILKRNIEKLVSAKNMHIHIDLIAGLPEEGLESFKESFNTAYYLRADMLQLGFLKLLHGADMREYPDKFPCEFSPLPPYEVVSTPYLENDEIALLKLVEDALERTYNSGRFVETLEYMESLGVAPFDVFERLASEIGKVEKISFDQYAKMIFEVFSSFEGCNQQRLRDLMLCDRMKSVGDGKIPEFLRKDDPFLKTAKHFLEKTPEFKRPSNTKRAVAILYSEDAVVWCDYTEADPVSGHFSLKKLPLSEIVKYKD